MVNVLEMKCLAQFEKFGWSVEWIELKMKRCVGELE